MLNTFFLAASITFWIRSIQVASFLANTNNQKSIMSCQWLHNQRQLDSRCCAPKRYTATSILTTTSYTPESQNATSRHTTFMRMALQQATLAGELDEVPIGAVVVRRCTDGTFEVLSKACNSMESNTDASAHAELLAMRKAAKQIGNWRLLNSTLYSTLEPCPMCLAAAQAFRIEEIVYGAPDLRLGAIETYMRMLDYNHPIHNIDRIVPGILKEESADMMRTFFQGRRSRAKRFPPPTTTTAKISRFSSWRKALFHKIRLK
jgi:tRNA(adenine34) deaminase